MEFGDVKKVDIAQFDRFPSLKGPDYRIERKLLTDLQNHEIPFIPIDKLDLNNLPSCPRYIDRPIDNASDYLDIFITTLREQSVVILLFKDPIPRENPNDDRNIQGLAISLDQGQVLNSVLNLPFAGIGNKNGQLVLMEDVINAFPTYIGNRAYNLITRHDPVFPR